VPARSLNLGILAHVDAGKTTLTERLLHLAGVIDEPGSVDSGTTQTDTMALERQRGITIKAAVVAFPVGDTAVNVVDTPGHPDFISEVERVLAVLDGAVLVLSAVEGVQPQTRVLMRALQRLHVPTLLFINKIDRIGADPRAVLAAVRTRLTSDVLAMGSGPTREAAPPASGPTTDMMPPSATGRRRRWPSTTTSCSRPTSRGGPAPPVRGARRWRNRPGPVSCTRCSPARR
jgi:small GTP-binding protein